MGIFFGTDGIRGIVNNDLTYDLAYKCGNALGSTLDKPTILIGQDTRISGSFITLAFSVGAMNAGANIIDVGVCPTAGVAYLTKATGADYGVVISASHNPPEYNGIKIFDCDGFKLGDERENMLERKFVHNFTISNKRIGTYKQNKALLKLYEEYLIATCNMSLKGLKIVLDASNGASYSVAPYVFSKLGATIIKTHCENDGVNINNNCGSLYPENLAKIVVENGANVGFAFDGDSDRLIACDENGQIVDGDMVIYSLAKYFKSKGCLKQNKVVGTRHTNMGIEKELNSHGISLERTDIGDKYVLERMEQMGLSIGGEKSGHIILRDFSTTGDGILSAIKVAEMMVDLNQPLSTISHVYLFPQCNLDCMVSDKMRIINSEKLSDAINSEKELLGENARIMVRVSGTEAKIRIMVETNDKTLASQSANRLLDIVKEIDKGE